MAAHGAKALLCLKRRAFARVSDVPSPKQRFHRNEAPQHTLTYCASLAGMMPRAGAKALLESKASSSTHLLGMNVAQEGTKALLLSERSFQNSSLAPRWPRNTNLFEMKHPTDFNIVFGHLDGVVQNCSDLEDFPIHAKALLPPPPK